MKLKRTEAHNDSIIFPTLRWMWMCYLIKIMKTNFKNGRQRSKKSRENGDILKRSSGYLNNIYIKHVFWDKLYVSSINSSYCSIPKLQSLIRFSGEFQINKYLWSFFYFHSWSMMLNKKEKENAFPRSINEMCSFPIKTSHAFL